MPPMYKTAVKHAAIALVVQIVLTPVVNAVLGGVIALALYLGREIAQHEYKIAVRKGWRWGDGPKPIKWYDGIVGGWSKDSILDMLLPVIAVALFSIIWFIYKGA